MPVNTMATPGSSAALMTSWSRTEPPGWMTAVAPASTAPEDHRRREERVGCDHRAFGQRCGKTGGLGGVFSLAGRDARRSTRLICPAPMPTVAPIFRVDDGVRLHMLGDREGEAADRAFRLRSAAVLSRFQIAFRQRTALSRDLHQKAAGHGLGTISPRRGSGRPPRKKKPEIFLSPQRLRSPHRRRRAR